MDNRLADAKQWARDGYYPEALRALRSLEEEGDASVEVLYLLAAVLHMLEEDGDARSYIDRCLQADPDHPRATALAEQLPPPEGDLERTHEGLIPGSIPTIKFETEPMEETKVGLAKCRYCGSLVPRECTACPRCQNPISLFPWRLIFNYASLSVLLFLALFVFVKLYPTAKGADALYFRSLPGGGGWQEATEEDAQLSVTGIRLTKEGYLTFRSREFSYSGTVHGTLTNYTGQWIREIEFSVTMKIQESDVGFTTGSVYSIPPGGEMEIACEVPTRNRPSDFTLRVKDVSYIKPSDTAAMDIARADPMTGPFAVSKGPGFWARFAWGTFLLNIVMSGLAIFLAARSVAMCSNMKWDWELKEDAVVTVLAMPILIIVSFLGFFLIGGTQALGRQGISLGPIVYVAMMAPVILYFAVVAFFFKRGCVGTVGIVFFAIFIRAFLDHLCRAIGNVWSSFLG